MRDEGKSASTRRADAAPNGRVSPTSRLGGRGLGFIKAPNRLGSNGILGWQLFLVQLLLGIMAHIVTPLDQPSNYRDSQSRVDRARQQELLSKSTTLYVRVTLRPDRDVADRHPAT